MNTSLELKGITKSYPDYPDLLAGIDLKVQSQEIVALQGSSGCGKTTLLRIIAGLEKPEQGRVSFRGKEISSVPTHQRNFGLLFQGGALFPHLNVEQNIAFGPRVQGQSRQEIRQKVAQLLEIMELQGIEKKSIDQLSGGQKQRVALARCLAPEPDLLLLDEPTSSLDADIKARLILLLKEKIRQSHLPAIYVTHDPAEARSIADRVLRLEQGRLIPAGN